MHKAKQLLSQTRNLQSRCNVVMAMPALQLRCQVLLSLGMSLCLCALSLFVMPLVATLSLIHSAYVCVLMCTILLSHFVVFVVTNSVLEKHADLQAN